MKLISTLFLFAALATMLYVNIGQVGGVYMNIDQAKKESAEKINTARLHTLTISESEFQSGKASYVNSNEISYKGSLYDIASTDTKDGKVTLTVLHDEKEEGLIASLKDMVDSWLSDSPRNSKQPSGKQLVTIKDYIPAGKFTFYINDHMQEVLPLGYFYHAQAPSMSVLKSPPKVG